MNTYAMRRSLGKWALILGVGATALAITGRAMAGCGLYSGSGALPGNWAGPPAATGAMMPAVYRPGDERFMRVSLDSVVHDAGIVGLWKVTFVSDGTAYPAPIPFGAIVDFGTAQWNSDGTEIMVSGGRPPSSGDVCMGVWRSTGRNTYMLKHVALAWVSSDTPPPLGPVSPAAFVGPAIIREAITLDRSRNAFEGTFTIDQYAKDETTLLQHIGGKISGTRITVD
jgi:hypothetical protein